MFVADDFRIDLVELNVDNKSFIIGFLRLGLAASIDYIIYLYTPALDTLQLTSRENLTCSAALHPIPHGGRASRQRSGPLRSQYLGVLDEGGSLPHACSCSWTGTRAGPVGRWSW
jgi:hypothetical protein